jgi:hypothetical protein
MSRRAAARLAWSMWVHSLALTALGLFLLALSLSRPGVTLYYYWLETALVAVGYSTVGAVVASRMPDSTIGWLFCTIGLLFGVIHFTGEYAMYTLVAMPGSLPAGEVAAWIFAWIWVPSLGLIVFLLLVFPDGRLPGALWRWVAGFTVSAVVAGAVLAAFSPGAVLEHPFENPLGIEDLPNASKAVEAFMYALVMVGASSMLARLRHAGRVERQQIKWFAYATTVSISGVVLKNTVFPALGGTWVWWVGLVLTTVGLAGSPVAMGIAILRYRLYEIDLLINRTLVYGSLTVTLALVYFGSVVATQAIFRALTGQEQQPQLAIVVSTMVIAALFNPLRRRIQGFIDRRFYRRKYDARKTLEAFSAKLRDETDLDALSDDLTSVVRETMQPAHISLWLRPDLPPKGSEGPK